jgi:hypothetical protein
MLVLVDLDVDIVSVETPFGVDEHPFATRLRFGKKAPS